MSFDIFISYRRSDAETHAVLLHRELVSAGYSAFFDHQSLGRGNWKAQIKRAIDECTDFVLLLSENTFCEKIQQDDDVLRFEISCALKSNKNIIGIMLPGFDAFPNDLPDELSLLPDIQCLTARMDYYDAMIARLTSGQFLISVPRMASPVPSSDLDTFSDESMQSFSSLPISEKQNYIQFFLRLAHEFNFSPSCMRLYKYLDDLSRDYGLNEILPYQGVIPTDYATYLNFFENLYLILKTKTIDIAFVDPMYRFRFFAACNCQAVQESELFPLGFQYPSILALYDYWSEYIRTTHQKANSDLTLSQEFPMWNRDLHILYNLYQITRKIRFINKSFEKALLTFKRLSSSDYETFISFQKGVLARPPINNNNALFEPLTQEEITYSLKHDTCIGVYSSDSIVALLSIIPVPTEKQNLLLELEEYHHVLPSDILIVDCILVAPEVRGFGLQRAFLRFAEFIAQKRKIKYIAAVASPDNTFSELNFIKLGYQMKTNQPKYHSTRNYFIKVVSS